ncbi:MAG: transporter substrate-binding domain-containing protein [Litoreibacter sp.]|nr:transporter substrate-binding domain-containing protein [Litoreibacter sp.]
MIRKIATAFVISIATSAQADISVTFALADNYAPLMSSDGGIAGDIIDEVNERLNGEYKIEVESVPWARAVKLVESGRAQGLVGTYYRPEVRPWINPYSEPLLQDPVSVFCREGVGDPSWDYPNDFAGLVFGYLIGSYAGGSDFDAMRDAGAITVEESSSLSVNLRKLKAGRIDCFVEGRFAILSEIAGIGGIEGLEIINDVSKEDFYVGFESEWASSPSAADFISAFNATIQEMHKDGTIDQLLADGLNNKLQAKRTSG